MFRGITAGLASLLAVAVSATPAVAGRELEGEWYLKSLRVSEAQRITKGAGVTVAVIDSGVWAGHPDLHGAVLPGRNVLYGRDGREDIDGHGTAMAGIIAARGRGGERGILGIAPAAKILPVTPYNDAQFLIEAIQWSVKEGAKVINMSFSVIDFPVVHDAIRAAIAADVVVVASAGNSGDRDNAEEFPAAYPEVLAVGALDRQGKAAAFSQRGEQVDLMAPGVDIRVADKKSTRGYAKGWGTSQAAAIVSGAAALVRAKYPDLSAAQVVDRLTSTAKDKGKKGRDDEYGHGELDLMAALTAKAPPPFASPSPPMATAPAAASAPAPEDAPSIPPLAIMGAGVVLLLGAGVAALMVFRRPSDTT